MSTTEFMHHRIEAMEKRIAELEKENESLKNQIEDERNEIRLVTPKAIRYVENLSRPDRTEGSRI